MVLTHKVNCLKHTNEEIKKTKFEKFKDFVKEKSFLIAVPLVLTFYPISVNSQEIKVNYEHENVEKEVNVNINEKMKKAHSQYKNNRISERDYEIKLFKEIYSQLREKDFPRTQLSVIVKKIKEELNLEPEPELPKVKQPVRKRTPTVEKREVEKEKETEITDSVLLYEEIETFEYQQNLTFEKINNAFEKLIQAHNDKNVEIIEIEDFNMRLHNNEDEINAALEFLFEKLSLLQEKTEIEIEKLKLKVDSCETCTDKQGLKFLLEDLSKEHLFVRASHEGLVNRYIHKIHEIEVGEKESDAELVKTEKEIQKEIRDIANGLVEEHYAYIIYPERERKGKEKPKIIISSENTFSRNKASIPSYSGQGINQGNIRNDLHLSMVTRSGFGFNVLTGFSTEQISFLNNFNNLNPFGDLTYYKAENYLGKFMGGFSYNTSDFSISLLGGYKVGRLITSEKMGRNNRYPILSLNLDLNKYQFTRFRSEVPLLFNEGELMNISLEHFSKHLVINSNLNYSRQSSIETTENGNIITNVYPVLDTQNILGVGVYPFKTGNLTFNPTLLVTGNYYNMNADNLQKIQAWSVGPGLGLNVMYKEQAIFSAGYALGFGKYNMTYTDLEGKINSFNLNSPYKTHNVFLMLNAPLSNNFSIGSKVDYARGDAKGKEEIRSPFRDNVSLLFFLTIRF